MEISFFEMLLVGLIAFVVLGPEELVRRAQQLGRFIAKARREWEELKRRTHEEIMTGKDIDFKERVQFKLKMPFDSNLLKSDVSQIKDVVKVDTKAPAKSLEGAAPSAVEAPHEI